jgi:predicted nucleic acid-binding protein
MTGDPLREFIDTNVLIYAHDVTAGEKYRRAQTLLVTLWTSQRGCLSIQILQEFFINVTRKLSQPILVAEASVLIADFAKWQVHSPTAQDVLSAIALHQRYHVSFWDALVIQSAVQLDCKILWSEDLSHGQIYAGVRVLNPFLS